MSVNNFNAGPFKFFCFVFVFVFFCFLGGTHVPTSLRGACVSVNSLVILVGVSAKPELFCSSVESNLRVKFPIYRG